MSIEFLIQLLLQVWLPVALLVAAGGLWTRYRADTFPAAKLRVDLNRVVVDVFAPTLLFALAAEAQVDRQMLTVPVIMVAGILVSLALLHTLLYRSRLGAGLGPESRAAILLAGSFSAGGTYAAFADVLASTPLLWTLGVWIATGLGHPGGRGQSLFRMVLTLPPVWGYVLGFAVNFSGVELEPLVKAAKFMGQATIPIMLFSLGLSIPWGDLKPTRPVLAAVAVKLAVGPLIVWGLTRLTLGELHPAQNAAILEVAMPTMVIAASFADRFNLDVRAAALTASWSSLAFLVTLPAWIALLS